VVEKGGESVVAEGFSELNERERSRRGRAATQLPRQYEEGAGMPVRRLPAAVAGATNVGTARANSVGSVLCAVRRRRAIGS